MKNTSILKKDREIPLRYKKLNTEAANTQKITITC